MPREAVKSQYETGDNEQPEISVHWGRDQMDVQIGVTLGPVSTQEVLGEQLADVDLSDEQRRAVVDRLTEPHSGSLGWYTHLDRTGTNHLIRHLRRARDHAFGADA